MPSSVNSCLNIMRRMPSDIEINLSVSQLAAELTDDLLQRADQPLQIGIDEKNQRIHKGYYNRDGDSYVLHGPTNFSSYRDGFKPQIICES